MVRSSSKTTRDANGAGGLNALALNLIRGDASSLPGPKRPQEPKPPFPYRSEDVSVTGPGGITLAGTFTAPNGSGPFAFSHNTAYQSEGTPVTLQWAGGTVTVAR